MSLLLEFRDDQMSSFEVMANYVLANQVPAAYLFKMTAYPKVKVTRDHFLQCGLPEGTKFGCTCI